MGMLGNLLRFGAGEGVMQGLEIGERGMREEEGKIMGQCFTSEGVIITRCEFHVPFCQENIPLHRMRPLRPQVWPLEVGELPLPRNSTPEVQKFYST